jgi:hypothetical protein
MLVRTTWWDRRRPERRPMDVAQREWQYRCTTAWPMPREIIHRLSGVVSMKATASEAAREAQNGTLLKPASIAPGTARMNALSSSSVDWI